MSHAEVCAVTRADIHIILYVLYVFNSPQWTGYWDYGLHSNYINDTLDINYHKEITET